MGKKSWRPIFFLKSTIYWTKLSDTNNIKNCPFQTRQQLPDQKWDDFIHHVRCLPFITCVQYSPINVDIRPNDVCVVKAACNAIMRITNRYRLSKNRHPLFVTTHRNEKSVPSIWIDTFAIEEWGGAESSSVMARFRLFLDRTTVHGNSFCGAMYRNTRFILVSRHLLMLPFCHT